MNRYLRIVNEEYEMVIYCHDREEELPVIWLPVQKEEEGARVYSLLQEMLPEAEGHLAFTVKARGLAGYSLAGLFAVHAMYHTACFTMFASVLGLTLV